MRTTGLYLALAAFVMSSCSEKTRIAPGQADSFIKTFSNGLNDVGNDVKQAPDGGYVLTGTTTNASNLLTSAFFIKTDKYGNLAGEQKTFENDYPGQNSVGNSIALTPDGGYMIAGTVTTASSGTDVMLVKLDANGQEVWNKSYDTLQKDDEGWCVRLNKAGNIVVVGSASIDNLASGFGKQLWYLELNASTGSVINNISGGFQFNDTTFFGSETGKYIDFLDEPNLYMAIGSSTSFDVKSSRIFLTEINSGSGNIIANSIFYNKKAIDQEGVCALYLPPSRMMFLGNTIDAFGNYSIYLARMNKLVFNPTSASDMNEWSLGDQSVQYRASSLRLMPDSSFEILSTRISGGNSDIDIMNFNNGFQTTTEHRFGDDRDQLANAFEVTKDGGFIIVGTNKPTDKKSEIILIKTNNEGKVE